MWIDRPESELARLGEPDSDAVRGQLNRLLSSPFFRHSKRLPKFLSYVIEHTLAGHGNSIKERTLGIEIFGRNSDYETATDPIVRVTAAEIRKRVAQYYQEPGHEDELRITLLSGSYVPRFEWPGALNENRTHFEIAPSMVQDSERPAGASEILSGVTPSSGGDAADPMGLQPIAENHFVESESPSEAIVTRHRPPYVFPISFAALLALCFLVFWIVSSWRSTHRSPIDFFWGPVFSTQEPVLICTGDQIQDQGIMLFDAANPSLARWFADTKKTNPFPTVAMEHLSVIVKLAAILQSNGGRYTVKGEDTTDLSDLRAGPVVLVGAFDNAWTLRLANSLRFRFANDPNLSFPRIIDSEDKTKPSWVTDQSRMGSKGSYRDFAIVARFTDVDTGKLAVIVAGIGRCGSLAAGQFVSDATNLVEVERAALAAGNKKNMELVLSTEVIDGQPGSPKIEAEYFW
jgi:hypothetical protein